MCEKKFRYAGNEISESELNEWRNEFPDEVPQCFSEFIQKIKNDEYDEEGIMCFVDLSDAEKIRKCCTHCEF